MENQPQTHESTSMETQRRRRRSLDEEGDDDDEESEELEEEVKEMAQKLSEYRSTFPGQLRTVAETILAAQRPQLAVSDDVGSEPESSTDPKAGLDSDGNEGNQGISRAEGLSTAENGEITDKLRLVREKISSNAIAVPIVLKRLHDCISRIDKLSSTDEIHPVFKRKKS